MSRLNNMNIVLLQLLGLVAEEVTVSSGGSFASLWFQSFLVGGKK